MKDKEFMKVSEGMTAIQYSIWQMEGKLTFCVAWCKGFHSYSAHMLWFLILFIIFFLSWCHLLAWGELRLYWCNPWREMFWCSVFPSKSFLLSCCSHFFPPLLSPSMSCHPFLPWGDQKLNKNNEQEWGRKIYNYMNCRTENSKILNYYYHRRRI